MATGKQSTQLSYDQTTQLMTTNQLDQISISRRKPTIQENEPLLEDQHLIFQQKLPQKQQLQSQSSSTHPTASKQQRSKIRLQQTNLTRERMIQGDLQANGQGTGQNSLKTVPQKVAERSSIASVGARKMKTSHQSQPQAQVTAAKSSISNTNISTNQPGTKLEASSGPKKQFQTTAVHQFQQRPASSMAAPTSKSTSGGVNTTLTTKDRSSKSPRKKGNQQAHRSSQNSRLGANTNLSQNQQLGGRKDRGGMNVAALSSSQGTSSAAMNLLARGVGVNAGSSQQQASDLLGFKKIPQQQQVVVDQSAVTQNCSSLLLVNNTAHQSAAVQGGDLENLATQIYQTVEEGGKGAYQNEEELLHRTSNFGGKKNVAAPEKQSSSKPKNNFTMSSSTTSVPMNNNCNYYEGGATSTGKINLRVKSSATLSSATLAHSNPAPALQKIQYKQVNGTVPQFSTTQGQQQAKQKKGCTALGAFRARQGKNAQFQQDPKNLTQTLAEQIKGDLRQKSPAKNSTNLDRISSTQASKLIQKQTTKNNNMVVSSHTGIPQNSEAKNMRNLTLTKKGNLVLRNSQQVRPNSRHSSRPNLKAEKQQNAPQFGATAALAIPSKKGSSGVMMPLAYSGNVTGKLEDFSEGTIDMSFEGGGGLGERLAGKKQKQTMRGLLEVRNAMKGSQQGQQHQQQTQQNLQQTHSRINMVDSRQQPSPLIGSSHQRQSSYTHSFGKTMVKGSGMAGQTKIYANQTGRIPSSHLNMYSTNAEAANLIKSKEILSSDVENYASLNVKVRQKTTNNSKPLKTSTQSTNLVNKGSDAYSKQQQPKNNPSTYSKSSTSLQNLPMNAQKLMNSILLLNNSNRNEGSFLVDNSTTSGVALQNLGQTLSKVSRVDFERLNSGQMGKQSQNSANRGKKSSNSTLLNQSGVFKELMRKKPSGVKDNPLDTSTNNQRQSSNLRKRSTSQAKKARLVQTKRSQGANKQAAVNTSSSTISRIQLPKQPDVKKSMEASGGGYFGGPAANDSGPMNPFLEQILKEIPNASSVNASVINSAAGTGAINLSGLMSEVPFKEKLKKATNQNRKTSKDAKKSDISLRATTNDLGSNIQLQQTSMPHFSDHLKLTVKNESQPTRSLSKRAGGNNIPGGQGQNVAPNPNPNSTSNANYSYSTSLSKKNHQSSSAAVQATGQGAASHSSQQMIQQYRTAGAGVHAKHCGKQSKFNKTEIVSSLIKKDASNHPSHYTNNKNYTISQKRRPRDDDYIVQTVNNTFDGSTTINHNHNVPVAAGSSVNLKNQNTNQGVSVTNSAKKNASTKRRPDSSSLARHHHAHSRLQTSSLGGGQHLENNDRKMSGERQSDKLPSRRHHPGKKNHQQQRTASQTSKEAANSGIVRQNSSSVGGRGGGNCFGGTTRQTAQNRKVSAQRGSSASIKRVVGSAAYTKNVSNQSRKKNSLGRTTVGGGLAAVRDHTRGSQKSFDETEGVSIIAERLNQTTTEVETLSLKRQAKNASQKQQSGNHHHHQQGSKFGSLLSVVKVAAKQKMDRPGVQSATRKKVSLLQKTTQLSLNTTQVLEGQLKTMKLASKGKASLNIPTKTGGNKQSANMIRSRQTQDSKIVVASSKLMQSLPQKQLKAIQMNTVTQQTQLNDEIQQNLSSSISNDSQNCHKNDIIDEIDNISQEMLKYGKQVDQTSNLNKSDVEKRLMQINSEENDLEENDEIEGEPEQLRGVERAENLNRSPLPNEKQKFDWSGFLSNLLHENLKPKKSTGGPGYQNISALYTRPPLQTDVQNKTQPLPKGLIIQGDNSIGNQGHRHQQGELRIAAQQHYDDAYALNLQKPQKSGVTAIFGSKNSANAQNCNSSGGLIPRQQDLLQDHRLGGGFAAGAHKTQKQPLTYGDFNYTAIETTAEHERKVTAVDKKYDYPHQHLDPPNHHEPSDLGAAEKARAGSSEYRPRIGRKHIEIANPSQAATQNFAATLNNIQLKRTTTAGIPPPIQPVNVLSEVSDKSAASETKERPLTSRSAPTTQRSPEKVDQEYKFSRLLGEGAYAVVRLAYKRNEGKSYAAKIYDKSKLVDEHRRNSVCREVMLMQKLNHEFIVHFVEAFETDEHVYVIMEHVQGKSLHDYLRAHRAVEGKTEFDQTLAEEEAKRILRQMLQALQYLHDQGITHRDIKLENILLDSTNNNVKLIDFGFSTCYKPQQKVKMFCGTPSYMAPEIVSRVEYYGPPADIWASGVLMFSLLNGYFPFKGNTDAELYRRIQRGAYKMIRNDLSDDCMNFLREMLNVNQDSRLTANELLQENWMQTDITKKLTQAEIRRQFKDKILRKIPLRNLNKSKKICIPAPNLAPQVQNMMRPSNALKNGTYSDQVPTSSQTNQYPPSSRPFQQMVELQVTTNAAESSKKVKYCDQASPPSVFPGTSAVVLPAFESNTNSPLTTNHNGGNGGGGSSKSSTNTANCNERGPLLASNGRNSQNIIQATSSINSDSHINREALLAYYNTSESNQMHPQNNGIAPPSGKFTPYSAYTDTEPQPQPASTTQINSANHPSQQPNRTKTTTAQQINSTNGGGLHPMQQEDLLLNTTGTPPEEAYRNEGMLGGSNLGSLKNQTTDLAKHIFLATQNTSDANNIDNLGCADPSDIEIIIDKSHNSHLAKTSNLVNLRNHAVAATVTFNPEQQNDSSKNTAGFNRSSETKIARGGGQSSGSSQKRQTDLVGARGKGYFYPEQSANNLEKYSEIVGDFESQNAKMVKDQLHKKQVQKQVQVQDYDDIKGENELYEQTEATLAAAAGLPSYAWNSRREIDNRKFRDTNQNQ